VDCVSLTFPGGVSAGEGCATPMIGCGSEPHGPWDTPKPNPSSVDRRFTHVFQQAGMTPVGVVATSRGGPYPRADGQSATSLCPRIYDHDPYGSSVDFGITIDIAP
jgi:hypothetical protein